MATWPASLPAPLVSGFSETLPNNVIRTQMDVGPPKVRRRTTANVASLTVPFLLSAAQATALIDFYEDDAAYGAIAFNFTHPRTGATVSCRFVEPPQLGTSNGSYFPVTVQLEVLP